MKKPKLSEIYSLMASSRPLEHKEDVNAILYLLKLVERLGKEFGNQVCYACENYFSEPTEPCSGCEKARALLKELEQ